MGRNELGVGVASLLAIIGLSGCGGESDKSASSTITSTAAQTTADWNYLKSEYAEFLAKSCGDSADPGGLWAACAGLLNAELDSFERDAKTLPMSKGRSDLLGSIDDFREHYGRWQQRQCPSVIKQPKGADVADIADCGFIPLEMAWAHETISNIVQKNADNQ